MLPTDAQREAAARVIEKYGFLEGLFQNPDFVKWREIGPGRTLKEMEAKVLNADRSKEGWKERLCDDLAAYQSLRLAIDDSLSFDIEASHRARVMLSQREEPV